MTLEASVQEQQDLTTDQVIITISSEGEACLEDAMSYVHKKIKKELKKYPELRVANIDHSSGYSPDHGYFASAVVIFEFDM